MAVTSFAFLLGIGLGFGILTVLRAAPRPRLHLPFDPRLWTIGSVLGLVASLGTGWVVAGFFVHGMTLLLPSLFGSNRQSMAMMTRSDALATWIENLHDTLVGGATLRQALVSAARSAPPAIAVPAQTVSSRLQTRKPLPATLWAFADELDDPAADLVVMALVMADDPLRHASNVAVALEVLGRSVRDEAAMRRRVHASRARIRTTVSAVTAISLVFVVGLAVFSRKFLQPYDSLEGQVMLALIGGLFALAFVYLRRLSAPVTPQRFLRDSVAVAP